jgi:hypothetical protein
MLLVKVEDDLNSGDFVDGTELNGLGGTQKIHRFRAVARHHPGLFEIQLRLFVLEQNFHRFAAGSISSSRRDATQPQLIVVESGWCHTNCAESPKPRNDILWISLPMAMNPTPIC